jgi:thiol reductant ABC exporter CydD subunit
VNQPAHEVLGRQVQQMATRTLEGRIGARVPLTRWYLAGAVVLGAANTVVLVIQAVVLANILKRSLLEHQDLHALRGPLVALGVTFAVRAILTWLAEIAALRTSLRVSSTLRQSLLSATLNLGPAWLAGERSGELAVTTTRGIDALEIYFGRYLPQAVLAVLAPVGILVWVGTQDWLSAVILLALLGVVPVAMVHFGRDARRRTERQWRRLSALSARFLDLLQGLATLRAFGRSAQGRREVAEATAGLAETTMGTLRVALLSALSMELLSGFGVGFVAMALGLRLLDGTVPFTTALAILLVSPEVFLAVRRAGAEFHASTEGQVAGARILDILDAVPEVTASSASGERPVIGHSPLRLQHVRVEYEGRSGAVFDEFDLRVEPGEHLALLGPSGSGKSTLLSVLLGFITPAAGMITIADTDLRSVPLAWWRRQISWVPQQPYLFRGTLLDNLTLGGPASTEALERALWISGLEPLVRQLPQGLSSAVGEGGLTLSAGERQRVAIARAIVRDAPLVLLDEPTAHLDTRTAAQIEMSASDWLTDKTVLLAAHRPALVARLDRVVELSPAVTPNPGPR